MFGFVIRGDFTVECWLWVKEGAKVGQARYAGAEVRLVLGQASCSRPNGACLVTELWRLLGLFY